LRLGCTLFPYTTLFRSRPRPVLRARAAAPGGAGDAVAAAVAGDGGDAGPVGLWRRSRPAVVGRRGDGPRRRAADRLARAEQGAEDRKSTRLNSSHVKIS